MNTLNDSQEVSALGIVSFRCCPGGFQFPSFPLQDLDRREWSNPGGGGVLPYITLYRYVPPKGVVILKLLIQNGVSISEAFSRTGYNISNVRKLHFCKQPFESIQGQITFKNTVQCVNKQTVVLLCYTLERSIKKLANFQNGVSVLRRFLERDIKNWPLSRTGYQFKGKFFLERGANLEFREAHTHTKNTQVTPPWEASESCKEILFVQRNVQVHVDFK